MRDFQGTGLHCHHRRTALLSGQTAGIQWGFEHTQALQVAVASRPPLLPSRPSLGRQYRLLSTQQDNSPITFPRTGTSLLQPTGPHTSASHLCGVSAPPRSPAQRGQRPAPLHQAQTPGGGSSPPLRVTIPSQMAALAPPVRTALPKHHLPNPMPLTARSHQAAAQAGRTGTHRRMPLNRHRLMARMVAGTWRRAR